MWHCPKTILMKKYSILLLLFLAFGISCELKDSPTPTIDFEEMEAELAILTEERQAIQEMANSVDCDDSGSCEYVAFGSKPCGGPWTYLAYNTNIDEDAFLQRVEDYNASEAAFNVKFGIVSDCTTPVPPIAVECIDGVCTTIY